MLTMEQVYRIRNMKKYEGKSVRKIASITGHDCKTVKKYIEKEDFNLAIRPKQNRKGKLSPYRNIIISWLISDQQAPPKQQHTAKRVYDRLQELYHGEFKASERSVRKCVAQLRKELHTETTAFLPLEHPPGEAQGDFGEARFVENGKTYDGYYFNLSYPYSNAGHIQLFKSANQECLLEGMKAIFEHIGGVPTVIWFDNLSPAVKKIREYGKRDLTDGFLRFMMHYGFQSNFCNPDSGHEKGSVESKVGYHRRNLFVPVPECQDLKDYNQSLLSRCDQDMQREHYRGYGTIHALFQEDKQAFSNLPKIPFEVFQHEFAKANHYGKVKFDHRTYSTSPRMAGCQVIIKAGAYEVVILDSDYHPIITHRRLYGKETESMNWIPYLDLLSRKPTAFKYSGIYQTLPTVLQEYLDQQDYVGKKEILKLLARITKEADFHAAIRAFEEGLRLGVSDLDSIWALHCHLTSKKLPEPEIVLSDSVPELKGYTPDITLYDDLFQTGGRSS